MTFDEWYEANKESLTVLTREGMLRRAFNAGFNSRYAEGQGALDKKIPSTIIPETGAT